MVWDQFFWWSNNEDYSFGFLVPFFVGYVVYMRWPIVRSYLFCGAPPGQPAQLTRVAPSTTGRAVEWVFTVILLGSLALYGLGMLVRMATGPEHFASLAVALSFFGLLLSSVFIFSKETVAGDPIGIGARMDLVLLFVFPGLIWLLSAPMLPVIDNALRVFLMEKVTVVVFGVFDFLGYEIERQGNILILPQGKVGVEEACSGIRSLTGCLFVGSFFGAVFMRPLWKKVLMVVLAMGFAVVMNLIRSMFLTIWAYHKGPNAIDSEWSLPLVGDIGTVHDVTGMSIMIFTGIGLMFLLPIVNYSPPDFDDEENEGISGPAPKSGVHG